jgi:hypothetical protein
MEGADWATLRATDGGLSAHVVVDGRVNSRQDRGLARTVRAETGEEYWRWNKCLVGGFALGPLRRMDELRRTPWLLVVEDFARCKMFGVRLLNGQVLFVDGVASKVVDPNRPKPTEKWELVGACFDVVTAELVERIENVDVAQDMVTVDVDAVKEVVLLAYDLGNRHTITVINPNNYFKMIPVTQGRLRVTTNSQGHTQKVMELVSLPDLHTMYGHIDFTEKVDDLSQHNIKWYDSCACIEGPYAKHQQSLETLAAMKPDFKINATGKNWSQCSHEMLPWGTAQTVAFIDKESKARDGQKPSTSYKCCDIGFGAGGYIMALALLTHHRGWIIGGVEKEKGMVSVHHEWMAGVVDLCPGMAAEMCELKTNCIEGEVTRTQCDESVARKIEQADFIFVNNFLFHDMCGRGAKEGSLSGTIAEMACGCKVGTWVVCTAPLAGEKNGKELLLWKRLKWKRHSFSWTTNEVEGFLYHVVATAQVR